MAKGIYLEKNGLARKVKKIYIGENDGIARMVKKAYVGVDGIAKLFYASKNYEYIDFNSLITPTEWTTVTKGTEYIATNSYGEWNIEATNYRSVLAVGAYVSKVFDNNTGSNNYWASEDHSDDTDIFYVILNCPVAIKPTQIYWKYRRIGINSYLQGLNVSTGEWENLARFGVTSSEKEETLTLTTENYYSSFRLACTRRSVNYEWNYIYEFQIQSGTIRIEA